MPTINAKCQICGNGYHRCAKCKDIPHYKNVVDAPECFGIYCILHEYRENVINGTEATERFERLDIQYDKLIPAVARDIKEIVTNSKKKTPKKLTKEKE